MMLIYLPSPESGGNESYMLDRPHALASQTFGLTEVEIEKIRTKLNRTLISLKLFNQDIVPNGVELNNYIYVIFIEIWQCFEPASEVDLIQERRLKLIAARVIIIAQVRR